MSDPENTDPVSKADASASPLDETPVQRALRLKQAAIAARPQPPRGGRFQREQSARVAAGTSKPWMKK